MTSVDKKIGLAALGGIALGAVAAVLGRSLFKKSAGKSADKSKYKLIYFNAKARGEVSRLLFAVSKTKFEDVRYSMDPMTEFNADKSKFPFGQLPVLEVDGKLVAQSHAIERFLAGRFNLLGDSDTQAADIDAVSEAFIDIKESYKAAKAKGDADKAKYFAETLPKMFSQLEALAKREGNGSHFVGDRISLADIGFMHLLTFWDDLDSVNAALSGCPTLRAINAKVASNPEIANWVKLRPVTKY